MDTPRHLAIGALSAMALSLAHGNLAADELPILQSANGVTYATGGIGLSERDAMEAAFQRRDFNLKLVFATSIGSYLANVPINVRDTRGNTVFETTSEGPWLYVKLPPGQYRVSATIADTTLTRDVSVGSGQTRQVVFQWHMPGDRA